MEEEIKIAEVTWLGDIVTYEDEYYGYYDMYCTNMIRIDKILSREEILAMYLDHPSHWANRFLQGFRLTEKEIEQFRLFYSDDYDVLNTISYYQEGELDTYKKIYQYRK